MFLKVSEYPNMEKNIQLTFLSGLKKGQNFIFKKNDVITIGREKNNVIELGGENNKSVSREHAKIIYTDRAYTVIDSSTNGTFLNDIRLAF